MKRSERRAVYKMSKIPKHYKIVFKFMPSPWQRECREKRNREGERREREET